MHVCIHIVHVDKACGIYPFGLSFKGLPTLLILSFKNLYCPVWSPRLLHVSDKRPGIAPMMSPISLVMHVFLAYMYRILDLFNSVCANSITPVHVS